jgi:SnoaL-like domain
MSEVTINDTMTVGSQLVDLCRQGKEREAIESLYAPEIVSIEAVDFPPNMPKRVEGLADVLSKDNAFQSGNQIHSREISGPYPHGDRFIVQFKYDVTPKGGPMAGQRMTLDETALYRVADGKVVHEEFFYHMPS